MLRGILVLMVVVAATALLAPPAIAGALVAPRSGVVIRLGRIWARTILASAGVRVELEGRERLAGIGAMVVVANHCSNFDIYALLAVFPGRLHWVAKASLFRIPVFGWAMRAGGFVPIEREDRNRAVESLGRAREILGQGHAVMFFPEGTRSPDGRLRRFKKGAFVTAIQAGVPVVPVGINGSHRVQPRRSVRVRPAALRVVIGEPLPTEGLTHEDRGRLLERTWRRMLTVLEEEQHPGPDARPRR